MAVCNVDLKISKALILDFTGPGLINLLRFPDFCK